MDSSSVDAKNILISIKAGQRKIGLIRCFIAQAVLVKKCAGIRVTMNIPCTFAQFKEYHADSRIVDGRHLPCELFQTLEQHPTT